MSENLPTVEKRSVALFPMSDIERMAAAVAASNLFGVKTPQQALALMLVAQAEGKHPASAALEYDIIQGRPALKATAVQGRFQQAGGSVKWIESTDEHCIGEFSHPMGGTLRVEWTIQRARDAGLASKPTWKQYPRQMLRSRVVTEGVRAVYPACLTNSYSEDEVRDFIEVKAEVVDEKTGEILSEATTQEPATTHQPPQETRSTPEPSPTKAHPTKAKALVYIKTLLDQEFPPVDGKGPSAAALGVIRDIVGYGRYNALTGLDEGTLLQLCRMAKTEQGETSRLMRAIELRKKGYRRRADIDASLYPPADDARLDEFCEKKHDEPEREPGEEPEVF